MKLYDAPRAANPRRVRIFLAEKDVVIDTEPVDIMSKQHLEEPFARLNPLRRLPVLVLDDGTVITESIAICRYFEEVHPDPPLFGRDPKEKALVEMWQRRVEFGLLFPSQFAFRHTHPAMRELEVPQIPEWGEANKPKIMSFLGFLDREMSADGYVVGDAFSIADITALVAIDSLKLSKIRIPEDLTRLKSWYDRVSSRPCVVL
ncbi:glutathione S-transferase family protein [Amorphus orientalis]|uniref:Glutathione S-transferase n=1 Tax=Amorphus orientalis TaxID=649198 RepID=A0AAE3VQS7_9HYPH|nr:glutathione S-transferase [Amorphus orientalis]MDQ0316989.1 glutathione S-transferase [Amorphus orientalis]